MESIRIGTYHGGDVFWDAEAAFNRHMGVLGNTGSGKSVMLQKLAIELARQGQTILWLDHHSVIAENQVFEGHRLDFEEHLNVLDAYNDGIPCDLFSPLTFSDGEMERAVDSAGALVNILSRTMQFGTRQQAALRRAIHCVQQTKALEEQDLRALDSALEKETTAIAEGVREKLFPLTGRNVFRPGDWFMKTGNINVVRLSKFDADTQIFIGEILLAYIWRLAQKFQFKDNPIFVVVDECQNFPSGKGCTLGRILAEGRKFGVNLVLATQQLSLLQTSSEVQKRLTQSGLLLLFQPNKLQVSAMARIINPVAPDKWTGVLRGLGRGEFVAMGSLLVNNRLTESPLKISAFEETEEQEKLREAPRGRGVVKCF